MSIHVSDLMTHDVLSVGEEEEISLAEDLMRREHIRHLPVTDAGKVVGIVSHRDLLKAQAHILATLDPTSEEKRYLSVTAKDVMTSPVETISPGAPAGEAAKALLHHKLGCLLVIDADEKLVGILTEADFVKWLATDEDFARWSEERAGG
jgi:CBS domain-containing protein